MPTFRAKEAAEPGARPIQVLDKYQHGNQQHRESNKDGIWRERRIEVSVNKLRLSSAGPAAGGRPSACWRRRILVSAGGDPLGHFFPASSSCCCFTS